MIFNIGWIKDVTRMDVQSESEVRSIGRAREVFLCFFGGASRSIVATGSRMRSRLRPLSGLITGSGLTSERCCGTLADISSYIGQYLHCLSGVDEQFCAAPQHLAHPLDHGLHQQPLERPLLG